MKCLRILVADDHQMVRDGLKLLIGNEPDMKVVAEASNGEEALRQARRLKPDLVVMDLSMPGMKGLKATAALKAELPEVKILVLTSYDDLNYLHQLCRLKASGYVLKRSASGELLRAIRKVAGGQCYWGCVAGPTWSGMPCARAGSIRRAPWRNHRTEDTVTSLSPTAAGPSFRSNADRSPG